MFWARLGFWLLFIVVAAVIDNIVKGLLDIKISAPDHMRAIAYLSIDGLLTIVVWELLRPVVIQFWASL